MKVTELFKVEGKRKEEFTEMARVIESIRLGSILPDGRCLRDDLTAFEKEEVETYVLNQLMPEINSSVRGKSRRLELDYEQEKLFQQLLIIEIYKEFPKFNKAQHLTEKSKTYELSSFIELQSKAAFREYLIEEYTLPVNAIRNMKLISDAIAKIVMEQEIAPSDVTYNMVHEVIGEEKLISKQMIMLLLARIKGNKSLEDITEADEYYYGDKDDVMSDIHFEMDKHTKAKLDAVFVTFSDLELFILMKEFGFLGSDIRSMTAREISYQDFFVKMVQKDKLGKKHIEFGNVKVSRPGRDCGTEELLVEKVYYVEERYYNNKVAKIRKKLATLAEEVEKDDLCGCLEDYCRNLYRERGLEKLFCI